MIAGNSELKQKARNPEDNVNMLEHAIIVPPFVLYGEESNGGVRGSPIDSTIIL